MSCLPVCNELSPNNQSAELEVRKERLRGCLKRCILIQKPLGEPDQSIMSSHHTHVHMRAGALKDLAFFLGGEANKGYFICCKNSTLIHI